MVCGGIRITRITQANQNFLNGNSNLAKPYPTNVQTEICSIAIVRETTKELKSAAAVRESKEKELSELYPQHERTDEVCAQGAVDLLEAAPAGAGEVDDRLGSRRNGTDESRIADGVAIGVANGVAHHGSDLPKESSG